MRARRARQVAMTQEEIGETSARLRALVTAFDQATAAFYAEKLAELAASNAYKVASDKLKEASERCSSAADRMTEARSALYAALPFP